MTQHRFIRRQALMLAVTVSTVALLTACTTYEDWRRGITGSRSPQAVEGPRRPPTMNPQLQPLLPQTETQPQLQQQQPQPQSTWSSAAPADSNPYDLYDASGNPVAPKATAEEPAQEDFLSRLFSKKSAPGAEEPRKPLVGNPYYSAETAQAAPLAPAPQSASAMPETGTFSDTKPLSVSEIKAADQPSEASQQEAPRGSWLSRTMEKLSSPFNSQSEETAPAAEPQTNLAPPADEPYPLLSSVPPKSPQFASVRAGSQQQMEELQGEHMQAQVEKQALLSEPSQLDSTVPVELAAAPNTVPAVNVEPTGKATGSPEPVLLGHVSAAPETAAPPATQAVARPMIEEPPPAPQQAAAPTPSWSEGWDKFGRREEPAAAPEQAQPQAPEPLRSADVETNVMPETPTATASRPSYWWEGWNVFERKDKDKDKDEPAPQPDEPLAMPTAAAPVAEQQPPMLPLLTPAAAPSIAEAEAVPQETSAAEVTTGSALPSPAILQQVKTLPPSRYSTRMQSLQRPLGTQ